MPAHPREVESGASREHVAGDLDVRDIPALLATGNVGITPSGSFAIGALNGQFPDLDYGVTYLPGKDGGASSFAGGDNFVVSNGTTKTAGIKAFLEYAYSVEGQTLLARNGSLPVRADVAKQALDGLDPRYLIAVDAMAKGKTPYTTAFNDLINAETLVFCQICGRILYLAEQPQNVRKRVTT